MSVAKLKTRPRQVAPWVIDGRPELWVHPPTFAKVVNRSRSTVYEWLKDGGATLYEFGYEFYRDAAGAWYIRISETEYLSLCRK